MSPKPAAKYSPSGWIATLEKIAINLLQSWNQPEKLLPELFGEFHAFGQIVPHSDGSVL